MIAGDKVDNICCPVVAGDRVGVENFSMYCSVCLGVGANVVGVLVGWEPNSVVAEDVEYDVWKLDEVVGNNRAELTIEKERHMKKYVTTFFIIWWNMKDNKIWIEYNIIWVQNMRLYIYTQSEE